MNFTHQIRHYTEIGCVLKGRAIHCKLITSGSRPDVFINNHLISMYSKFKRIKDAHNVFDKMPDRNLISWTTLISSYSRMGLSEQSLSCFRLMVGDGFDPNDFTYVSALPACTSLEAVRNGKEIHGKMFRLQQDVNSFVSNCLINFYGKCGFLRPARVVFDSMLERNQVSWTTIVSCCCQCGEDLEGVKIFLESRRVGVKMNAHYCASVLGACVALECLEFGMQVHCHAVKCGVRKDLFVMTGLVNFYVKCCKLGLAEKAFWELDNQHLSAWTALIGGYVQLDMKKKAIDLFCKLLSSGTKPSEQTYCSVLGAFADTKEIKVGKQLHSLIIKMGFISFTFVGNAVLDFYSKSGILEDSLKIFDEIDSHDVITWNALIDGHVKSGCHGEAIELLRSMLVEGFDLNLYTYSILFSVCGDLPAVEWGKQAHCCVMKSGFHTNVVVGSALVDMYAKCGRLRDARKTFDSLPCKNLVSWNTMLVGYAQHGFGKETLEIYDLMPKDKIKPNHVTFIGVLSACGHVGLLEEGLWYFSSMTKDYKITPRADHLACMVSIFARKGQIQEAYDFIRNFPAKPDKVVWRCLLSSCKTHKNLDIGRYAAEKILNIDPDDTSALIMLSNIYAESKMWNETAQIRKLMKEKSLKKDLGTSWTELNNKRHSFSSGHSVQIEGNNVLEILDGLTTQLYDAGYVPDVMFPLNAVE
ncbi:Pentatricopeptide repeat-containing protein [Heracleum sosnowskyi]|uniref:Pentatricopeptide repeat-containing protein n=1 Tax=Heracleum sosnowskyi TaxID=360622 RepID=A0AAD8ICI5_9APIA|nr:Pentatricopeptide repeat-containing protein [Heracleum sosnowskyi]